MLCSSWHHNTQNPKMLPCEVIGTKPAKRLLLRVRKQSSERIFPLAVVDFIIDIETGALEDGFHQPSGH